MSQETEMAELRKQLRAAQALIHTQRARLRQTRHTRIALVAGEHVTEIDPGYEAEKAADLNEAAETFFGQIIDALRFYAAPLHYQGAIGPAAPILIDGGAKAKAVLDQITA